MLRAAISRCEACPRLVAWRKAVAEKPPRRFAGWRYWSRGVPGFGDPAAKLWVIGLAPAAHGANRTGRMFTGDSSGDWLYRVLYETGFASQPISIHREDGLFLQGAFISAAVRCAPPDNLPKPDELYRCFSYLRQEWILLQPTVRVIVALGHIAYRQVARLFPDRRFPAFRHGEEVRLQEACVIASYHPSQQNTRTGRLKWPAWMEIFTRAKALCEG